MLSSVLRTVSTHLTLRATSKQQITDEKNSAEETEAQKC